jgi:hypothetical protein
LVRVVTTPADRAKLVALRYIEESQKNDRREVGAAISRLIALANVGS